MINLDKIPTPLNGFVLVKPENTPAEMKSAGGLFMATPQNQVSQLITAEVRALGIVSDMHTALETAFRVGQKVLMIRQSGTSVLIGGEEHLLIQEKHLLAVV